MDWCDFEKVGFLTKERFCCSSRTPLSTIFGNEEWFGVSIPNKTHGLYFNYLLQHKIVEKGVLWKVESFFGNKEDDSWNVIVAFTPNEIALLKHLEKNLWQFTPESVLKALRSTPELAYYINNCYSFKNYKNKEIHLAEDSIWIFHSNIGASYPESLEKTDADALFSYAKLISNQLRTLSLDTSKLVKKPKEAPLLPKWLEDTLKVGAKVGIKYLCAVIGAKIDFPDFGGDNSNNSPDFGDVDGGFDVGDDGYDFGGDDGFDVDGIAFQGKHFDGYEDLRKQIDVPIMGDSNSTAKLHVYKKLGSSTIYVSDGTCYPVSTAGRDWITVGSHKFEVSKIKSKV